MMSGIRSKNTKPELIIRRNLFACGFRYRLHKKDLPGKPDLVLRKHRVAIFVNGCFWHQHNCQLFKWPSSNREFWRHKITRNRELDCNSVRSLKREDWRVLTIWECALKGPCKLPIADVLHKTTAFIEGKGRTLQVRGRKRMKSTSSSKLDGDSVCRLG
jgi:DNA mismatch endonuclease (patch repair protein)